MSLKSTPHENNLRTLLALAGGSFILHLVLLPFKDLVGTDETTYLWLGANLFAGKGFTLLDIPITVCPPLFPIAAGLLDLITGDLARASRIVYLVCGSLIVLPVFGIGSRLYGRTAGTLGAAVVLVLPGLSSFVLYWGSMTEPLYILLIYSALYLYLVSVGEDRPGLMAPAGLLLGLAYLTRNEGLLYFLTLFALGIVLAARDRRLLRPRTLAGLAGFAVLFGLTALPYILYLRSHSGEWSMSGKTKLILLVGTMSLEERERLAVRLTPDGTWLDDHSSLIEGRSSWDIVQEKLEGATWTDIAAVPLLQILTLVRTLFSWRVFPFFLLPLVALGLLRGPPSPERRRGELILAASLAPMLVYLTFHIWPRYLLTASPVFAIWTGRGLSEALGYLTERGTLDGMARQRTWRILRRALVPAVIGVLLALTIAKPVRSRILLNYPIEYRRVGEFLGTLIEPGELVMARKPEVAFYAGAQMVPLPNEPYEKVIHFARHHGVRYLVVDEFTVPTRPHMRFLLESPTAPPPELVHLHTDLTRGRRTVVYEILGTGDGAIPSEGPPTDTPGTHPKDEGGG